MSSINNLRFITLGLAGSLMAAATMRSFADDMAGFSLADLGNTETDEIKAIETLLFAQGLYDVKIVSMTLGSLPAKEGLDDKGNPFAPLFYVDEKYEVLEAQPLDKAIDAESLQGRTITNRTTFWARSMVEFQEQIGLLKGRFQKAGLDNSGRIGGVEGGEPGWLDNAADEIIKIKVTHSKENSEGVQYQRVAWQKKAGGFQEDNAVAA